MEIGSQLDLISDLPQDVIETILVKLPIEDAVRTSILSSRWRYQWASMPDIAIDEEVSSDYCKEKFISRLLLLHNGPIRKFSLSSSYLQGTYDSDICQWLLFVSRKDVNELVIKLFRGYNFEVPCCLFSCKNLTRLELCWCKINPPTNFKGFPCLKSLSLEDVVVSQDKLEYLISSSHLLDNLKLSEIEMIDMCGVYLTVSAPNLKQLILEDLFVELSLVNTPNLVDLSVTFYLSGDLVLDKHLGKNTFCYFERILGGVPYLERLKGCQYFITYISLQVDSLQHKPIVFSHLKSLELYDVDFGDPKEVLAAVQIITNCPNLQDLQISGFSGDYDDESGNLNSSDWADPELLNLKTVKFTNFNAATHEMKFIEYLLECSPALQKMRISPNPDLSTDIKLETLIDLMAFRRASLVSVVFR